MRGGSGSRDIRDGEPVLLHEISHVGNRTSAFSAADRGDLSVHSRLLFEQFFERRHIHPRESSPDLIDGIIAEFGAAPRRRG